MLPRPRSRRAPDVYLYGMIVYSTIHRLAGACPEADGYGGIEETHLVPGGETGNSAIILSSLGHRVKVGGPFLGAQTRSGVLKFLRRHRIDCTGLHFDPGFNGVRDMVLVAARRGPSSAASAPISAGRSAGRLLTRLRSPQRRSSASIRISAPNPNGSRPAAPPSAGPTSPSTVHRTAFFTAASVCRRFPFALDPPSLKEISALAGRS